MKQWTRTGRPSAARFAPRTVAGLAIFTGILLAAAFLAASCSGSAGNSKAASGGGDRSSDAGSVKVVLSWDGPASGPVFKVVMDTHSVDLDGFDLSKLAALRTDGGVEVAPTGWDAPKGGHHREGALTFPATVDGRPLLGETVRGITIVLKDVAAPERSFQWTW